MSRHLKKKAYVDVVVIVVLVCYQIMRFIGIGIYLNTRDRGGEGEEGEEGCEGRGA